MKNYYIGSNRVCHIQEIDSDRVIEYLRLNSWTRVDEPSKASLILYNTCAYLQDRIEAALKGIAELNKIKKTDAKMIVLGCLPGIARQRLAEIYDGITLSPTNLIALDRELNSTVSIATVSPSVSLKTSDVRNASSEANAVIIRTNYGCGHTCSYCGIRKAFPKLKSKPIEEIIKAISDAVAAGATEITLTSEDVTAYGKETSHTTLTDLWSRITDLKLSCKISMPRLHPDYLIANQEQFLKFISLNKVSLLGIPVNSASSKVLKLMNRPYEIEKLTTLIHLVKEVSPKTKLSTDWVVGHPGETREDFEDSLKFFSLANIDSISPYPFSRIEGTAADKMDNQVSPEEMAYRMRMIDRAFAVFRPQKIEERK